MLWLCVFRDFRNLLYISGFFHSSQQSLGGFERIWSSEEDFNEFCFISFECFSDTSWHRSLGTVILSKFYFWLMLTRLILVLRKLTFRSFTVFLYAFCISVLVFVICAITQLCIECTVTLSSTNVFQILKFYYGKLISHVLAAFLTAIWKCFRFGRKDICVEHSCAHYLSLCAHYLLAHGTHDFFILD